MVSRSHIWTKANSFSMCTHRQGLKSNEAEDDETKDAKQAVDTDKKAKKWP